MNTEISTNNKNGKRAVKSQDGGADALTFDQLRVFRTVVAEGSFSAAARRLARAQSAISYAIANLERLLEVKLFDRSQRRPQLTDAGRSLLVDADTVSGHVDRLYARAKRVATGVEAEVSIAIDAMFPTAVLLDSLREFKKEYPEVTIKLHTEALGAAAQLVLNGACHIGIAGPMSHSPSELVRRPMAQVPMVPVVSKDHPLAQVGGPIPTAMIREHTQLVLIDRSALTEGLQLGVLGGRTWRLADLATKHALIRGGFGWGNLPRHQVNDEIAAGHLVVIQPEESSPNLAHPLYVIHRSAKPPGPAARWLVEHLEKGCG